MAVASRKAKPADRARAGRALVADAVRLQGRSALRREVESVVVALPLPRPNVFAGIVSGLAKRGYSSVTDHAEATMVLPGREHAEPGPIQIRGRTPYMEAPLETVRDPCVEETVVVSSTQVGKTTLELAAANWFIDQDPSPAMMVLPDQKSAREMSDERLLPVLESSPQLRRHLPKNAYDLTKLRYRFDRMDLHFAWAGSASGLASKPKRVLLFDEVDKYPSSTQKEADPISLARERQRTFHNKKRMVVSTPTVETGNIWRAWEGSEQHRYQVPCPHCGGYQVLVWPQVRYPKEKAASAGDLSLGDWIQREQAAWYACAHCEEKIEDRHHAWMLSWGEWRREDGEAGVSGVVLGPNKRAVLEARVRAARPQKKKRVVLERVFAASGGEYFLVAGGEDACGEDGGGSIAGLRTGRRVGFHLSALYSPWLTWSDIVCEWLRCKGDREALLNFVNSWLGEPWKDEKKSLRSERMAYWTEPYARGMIPLRAEVLTGGADVQQDYVWWRVSGRASTRESWLVDWGRTPSIEQLGAEGYADPLDRGLDLDLCWFADEVLDRLWMRYVDAQGAVCAASGAVDEEEVSLVRVCIDASHRTGSVYELCRRYHPLLVPVQGAGEEKARQVNRWQWFPAEKDAAVLTRRRKRGRRSELMYARLDTFSYKEELAFRFASSREDGTPGMFLPSDVSAEFIHQFCSEHKILARRGARGAVEERWVVRYAGIANHLWDCSVYDLAAADVHGIGKAKRMGEETRARRGGGEKKKFFANQKRKGG